MEIEKPKFRCDTAKAIDELAHFFNYPNDERMQDWEYEVANSEHLQNYLDYYTKSTDDDVKFCLVEMALQALEETEKEKRETYWKQLKTIIIKNIDIHEYTLHYWCSFDYSDKELSECWEITPMLRNLWNEIKNNSTE
ncbi:MAG: hypothetical protein KGV44_04725 [Flavobacteriaceae bacterium]|nr:hypothetical protein [Flavobacteriaceae bacterium]